MYMVRGLFDVFKQPVEFFFPAFEQRQRVVYGNRNAARSQKSDHCRIAACRMLRGDSGRSKKQRDK
jgi:hypothetical protein